MHGSPSDPLPTPRLLIESVAEVDSTNSELLRREPLLPPSSGADAIWLVAARQTAGRGRRQRNWISSVDGSLTASFAREVERPANIGALSLVAGVAVAQVLEGFGVHVRLKWPNDLHVAGGKAGGILCEARARGRVTRLVIGCGLILLAPSAPIGQAAGALFDSGTLPPRDVLSRALGCALLDASDRLLANGFEPFRREWAARDMLLGRAVVIHDDAGDTPAIACGIDEDGALLVTSDQAPNQVRRVVADEVSVRPLSR